MEGSLSAPVWTGMVDRLEVRVHRDRAAMGAAAAADCADALRDIIAAGGRPRAVFAAAPSQAELLAGLAAAPGLDWGAVTAFHMDEYIGLGPGAPESFGAFLRERLFGLVPLAGAEYLRPGGDPAAEAARYAALLAAAPIDIVCLGVGENGHLAFNDPPADLEDPLLVREVSLDLVCRKQQVRDGCFPRLEAVPERALTLTVPALTRGRRLFCVVPGPAKAEAVEAMLRGPVGGHCPASALRRHPSCVLYLDKDSAARFLRAGSAPATD